MNAIISTDVDNIEGLKKQLAAVPNMEGLELASKVSTKEPYFVGDENASNKNFCIRYWYQKEHFKKP